MGACATAEFVDGIRPSLVSAATSTDGIKVILTFDEALGSTAPPSSAFTVDVDGTPVSLSGSPGVSGATVTLTLASAVLAIQSVTVSHTDPTTSNDAAAIQDLVGNNAATFSSRMVQNNRPAAAGDEEAPVTLTWTTPDEDITARSPGTNTGRRRGRACTDPGKTSLPARPARSPVPSSPGGPTEAVLSW